MRSFLPLSLLQMVLLYFACPAHGAPLATSDLVLQAIAHNPEVRFYEAEIAAARAGRKAAGEIANPDLSLEGSKKTARSLADGSLEGDGPAWKAQILQTLDFPGRISLRKAIADREIVLAELGLAQ
ncbi:MAG: TolC family protein, partial [Roseimicrobium sp.]